MDHTAHRWRFVSLVATVILFSGCALDYTMEPEPAGPICPSQSAAFVTPADSVISWYGPAEARDRRKLADWCRTVGPSVIDSLPAPHYNEWTARDSLAIVTWNVNVGGGDLDRFLQEELNFDCEDSPPTRGSDSSHFVLLIQEALRRSDAIPVVRDDRSVPPRIVPDRPGEHPDITDVARSCGLALFYVPSMRNGAEEDDGEREDRGNAILSTLPLSDFVAVELPFEGSRKVTVAATVRSQTGDSLRLVNLHFSVSSTFYRTMMSGNSTRLRQAEGMTEALSIVEAERSPDGPPSIATVAGGDTNTWSDNETALRQLRLDYPDSPPSDGVNTRPPFPTDHIFFRRGPRPRIELMQGSYGRTENTYGSDHQARIVWLRTAAAGK